MASTSFLTVTPEVGVLNQYWYSAQSITDLVAASEEAAGDSGRIAFISTPSLYYSLPIERRGRHRVLDYDRQWESDPGFIFFDFKAYQNPDIGLAAPSGAYGPTNIAAVAGLTGAEQGAIPTAYHGAFDVVVIDPPFITAEVWSAYAVAARILLGDKVDGVGRGCGVGRVLCTTVAENVALLKGLFPGIARTAWQPSIPNLVYQYDAYANWDSAVLSKVNPEIPQ